MSSWWDVPGQTARLLEPVLRRISSVLARAVVTRVDDTKKLQVLQLTGLAHETLDEVQRLQPYGLTGVPSAGAEVVIVCPNGSRDLAMAIAADDPQSRPTGLADGEVCLYSKHGQRVKLKADGSTEISAGATLVTLDPTGAIALDATVSIDLTVGSTSISISSTGVLITTPGGLAEFT